MRVVLMLLGWYLVAIGAGLALKPVIGKRLTAPWMKDKLSRGWALVTCGLGGLIYWAAPASVTPAFIKTLGILGMLKGVYLLAAPKDRLARLVAWWLGLGPGGTRAWGVLALALGLAIVFTLP